MLNVLVYVFLDDTHSQVLFSRLGRWLEPRPLDRGGETQRVDPVRVSCACRDALPQASAASAASTVVTTLGRRMEASRQEEVT